MKTLTFYSVGLCLLPALLVVQHPADSPSITPAVSVSSARVTDDCTSAKGLAQVVCLADAFKATLTLAQVATVQLAYSKENAARWSNFPENPARPLRIGIRLGTLSAAQLKAAKALMAAVLADGVPNEGYDELEGGLAADEYFGTTTGKTDMFGAGNYFIAFLGIPGTTGLWELQYGGHHYAFANTYNGGKLTGVTPAFRGVEPMAAVTVNGRTYQPIEQERQAFADLLGSLSSTERPTALLPATFRDILLGPGRDGQFPATKQGLKVSSLNAAQKALVLNAIKRYVNDLDPAVAATVMTKYTAELADTYVAYSGSGTMSQAGDYVRIDGPGVWIEYSGQASRDFPGTVHPHSVWRDHRSDYGGN